MNANRLLAGTLSLLLVLLPLNVWADGINIGKPSALANLVPAAEVEQSAAQQYEQLKREAAAKGALAQENDPLLQRIRGIARRLIPVASRYNARASQWQWEINLINSKQVNAFCMPGGKIAVYTGLADGLKLTDDELAIVIGHEIAHALREHARSRMAKGALTQLGTSLLGAYIGGGKYNDLLNLGGNLLTLKFSRSDESEADTVGLDLAARVGYDPRAGVTLWRKMLQANGNAPPQWLSTHPAGQTRIKDIEAQLPQVMPVYEAARTQGK